MQIHNSILALQVMNNVRVYSVKFLQNPSKPKTRSLQAHSDDDDIEDGAGYFTHEPLKFHYSTGVYSYKSAEVFDKGDWVLVPINNGREIKVARIVDDATNRIDYDRSKPLLWINQRISDPVKLFNQSVEHDAEAGRKLAASQAAKAAQEHLAALGVDHTAFAVSSPADAKQIEEGKADEIS
jgi:hypothetical protein